MKYLRDLVKENKHEIKHFTEIVEKGVEKEHKYMSVFEYSEKYGGTYDSFKYYNDYIIDLGEEN